VWYNFYVAAALLVASMGCRAPNPLYHLAGNGQDGASGSDVARTDEPDRPPRTDQAAAADGPPVASDGPAVTPPSDGPPVADVGTNPDVRDATAAPTRDTALPEAAVVYKGDLTTGLALYLPFDDGVGSVARDASGKQSVASLKSIDATGGWGAGRFGAALSLKGTTWSGWVDVQGSALTGAANPGLTIALWIWTMGGDGGLVSRRSFGAQGYLFNLAIEGGSLSLQINSGAAYNLHSRGNGTVPSGRWVHVAATFDLTNVYLYVDGIMAGASVFQQAIPLDTSSVIVGGLQQQDSSVTARFPGAVDDVAIYSRALTADQIGGLAKGAQPPAR
jgi:hypothetical protein